MKVGQPLRGGFFRTALLAFALGVLGSSGAMGQVLVRGVVSDSLTGQPLAAATVQLEGETRGAITNSEGAFSLGVTRLPAVLIVRFIGYRSRRVEVKGPADGALAIRLEPDPVFMEEVVVSGEDPGVAIVREALKRKQAWRDTVSTSYAEVYSRFMLYREFQLVQVEETIGASWWRADGGVREVTRARRLRPQRRERFLYASIRAVPNLYDDQVIFRGTRYRGPLHPRALEMYRIRLTGQRAQDGRIIYDVAYSPSDAVLTGFIGTMAIEDSTFDVLSITARPVVGRVGLPPILEREVRLEQQFAPRGGAMVPVYFEANGWVRFGRAGVSYPVARYRQVSGLSLHATRVQAPDSLYQSDNLLRDDPAVAGGTWLFDWNPGMIPLTEQESSQIASLRNDRSIASYFRPIGMLAQYAAVPVSAPRVEVLAEENRKPRWVRPWLWYNRVDGWHLGNQSEIPVGSLWSLRPGVGYDVARAGVPWTMSAVWNEKGRVALEFGAERFSAITGVGAPRDRFLTGLVTYAGYDDYFDYYDRARRWGSVGVRAGAIRLEWMLSHEDHRSVVKSDDYDGWLREHIQRENPPVEPGRLASTSFRFTAGDAKMDEPRLAGHLDVRMETARKGFAGSDFGFVRWQGAASVRIPTLMRRRAVPATLRLDVVAGRGTSSVPVQRQGILDVATGPVAGAIGFRSRRDARLNAKDWLALFWEHDFGSALAERLGLGERTLGLLVFGAHGTAWHGSTSRRDEMGLAWSKPFNLPLRVNLATELTGFHPIVTVEAYGWAGKVLRR